MQNIQEASLAWALIEAAKPHLNMHERNHVFTNVGAGDSFEAIRYLLKLIATKRVVLHRQLVQECKAWAETYSLHEEQLWLCRIIEGFLTSDSSVPASTANRVTTTPRRLSIDSNDGSAEAGRGC